MAAPHPRRFRFALELHQPLDGRTWLGLVPRGSRTSATAPCSSPTTSTRAPVPSPASPPRPAVTTTLHVGPLVLDCDYRHPVPLARSSPPSTSSPRVASSSASAWGGRRSTTSTPASRWNGPGCACPAGPIEHTTVLKALFADGPVTFHGEHYIITDLEGHAQAHRPGGPPILIGGGAPRPLRFAGATADIVGVNVFDPLRRDRRGGREDGLATAIDQKVAARVREGAGERFDELELNAWLAIAEVTDDAASFAAVIAPRVEAWPEDVLESPSSASSAPPRRSPSGSRSVGLAGVTRTTSSRATRCGTSRRSSPSSPAADQPFPAGGVPTRAGSPGVGRDHGSMPAPPQQPSPAPMPPWPRSRSSRSGPTPRSAMVTTTGSPTSSARTTSSRAT